MKLKWGAIGAAVGIVLYLVIGGVGVAAGGSAVGIGFGSFALIGAVAGVAAATSYLAGKHSAKEQNVGPKGRKQG